MSKPPPCPRCDSSDVDAVTPRLYEPQGTWYRCRACRHLWSVPKPSTFPDATQRPSIGSLNTQKGETIVSGDAAVGIHRSTLGHDEHRRPKRGDLVIWEMDSGQVNQSYWVRIKSRGTQTQRL